METPHAPSRRLGRRLTFSPGAARESLEVKSIRRLIRTPQAVSRIGQARLLARLDEACLAEVSSVCSFLESNPRGRLRVVFDNAVSPPTYGDLFNVIMIGRFFACDGGAVEFIIIDGLERRVDWEDLEPAAQNVLVQDQLKLARCLLPDSVDVQLMSSLNELLDTSKNASILTIFWGLVSGGEAMYHQAPRLLRALTLARPLEKPPAGFLLTNTEPNLRHSGYEASEPYVAWHVRRALWDEVRDTSNESIMADFLELRTLFPRHEIVILSSANGIEDTLSLLVKSGLESEIQACGLRVYGQVESGFENAVRCVLGAEFYFQRRGGGVGQAAVFSTVPYVYISDDCDAFRTFELSGRSLVPWASEDQMFAFSDGPASCVSISSVLAPSV